MILNKNGKVIGCREPKVRRSLDMEVSHFVSIFTCGHCICSALPLRAAANQTVGCQ